MSAIMMTVEAVRTRASTSEALLTLSVPLENGALLSKFMSMIGKQVGVAFADGNGLPLVEPAREGGSSWRDYHPLTQSALTICKEPLFQQYAAERMGGQAAASESNAAAYMKEVCRVSTRKDLGVVDGSAERFGSLMASYREWQRARG